MKSYLSKYSQSFIQLTAVIALSKITEYLEYNITNRSLALLINSISVSTLLFYFIMNINYSYRISEKTILYLAIIMFALGLQHTYKTYCFLNGIILYRNYYLKMFYFTFKPLYFSLVKVLPIFYLPLNIAHMLLAVLLVTFERPTLSLSFYSLLYEAIDVFVLEELESKFFIEMLLPEIHAFAENLYMTLFNGIICIYDGGLTKGFERNEVSTILIYMLLEAIIALITLSGAVSRFTAQKESILVSYDHHVSNTADLFLATYISIKESFDYFVDYAVKCPNLFNECYVINKSALGYIILSVIHLVLYFIEFYLHLAL
jgi:hypothetical protein